MQAQFLRDRSQFFPGEVPARPQVEGEYDFGDLIVLASNWGAERPQEATPKNEQDGALPESDAALPETENGSSETLPASENGKGETSPASSPGSQTTPALPPIAGDLDRDGKVGEADLEKLRSSYSWQAGEIRGQPEPSAPQIPAAEPN